PRILSSRAVSSARSASYGFTDCKLELNCLLFSELKQSLENEPLQGKIGASNREIAKGESATLLCLKGRENNNNIIIIEYDVICGSDL
ncbi:MAG: hypothetical protein MJE68_20845, partial [Proteobacteria bacterium]|nr:hypothetical protein [Pseudomonadota bacterium]